MENYFNLETKQEMLSIIIASEFWRAIPVSDYESLEPKQFREYLNQFTND